MSTQWGASDTYDALCDASWFYDSELVTDSVGPLIWTNGVGRDVHVYGSNLRANDINGAAVALQFPVIVARAFNGSSIHIHGTGIDASATAGRGVRVLDASSGGTIHANETAYFLKAGAGGSVVRIQDNNGSGHIHAPYLWEHVPDAITIPDYTSTNGADQTTITTGTLDGHPHTAVYSSKCQTDTGGLMRWYDTTDKVCRAQ